MSRRTSLAPVLAGSLFALAGCVTSGRTWVQQPEDALTPATPPELGRASFAAPPSPLVVERAPDSGSEEPGEPPRHRLNHVVSLGEAAPSSPASSADTSVVNEASGPAPVVVNIVNYVAPGYAGYGNAYRDAPVHAGSRSASAAGHRSPAAGPTRLAPVSAGTRGTPTLAGDWQTPRSHGPAFPYHTGPASPWEQVR